MGQRLCCILLSLVAIPAFADQGVPVYTAIPTYPVAAGPCSGPRVQVQSTNPTKIWCCVAGAWAECAPTYTLSALTATSLGGIKGSGGVIACAGTDKLRGYAADGAMICAADSGVPPSSCSTGQAVTSTGSAFVCTSTLTASDVACSGACVSDSEISAVGGGKVSGTVANATFCGSCTSASYALTATSASVAADLACSGTCVADAEISNVSGSKVDGPVRFAESLAPASRPLRLTAGGWTGADWLSADVSSVELGAETAVAIHCYVPYQMEGPNAGIGLRFTGPPAAAFFATTVCHFYHEATAAATVTSLNAEMAPMPDGTEGTTVLGCFIHASFISANEGSGPLVLEYRSANAGAAAARVESGTWCTYLQ